jgi:hypothetical protein
VRRPSVARRPRPISARRHPSPCHPDASTSCLILTAKTKDGQSATDVQCTVTSVAGKTGAAARLTRNGHTVATGIERKGAALKLRAVAGRTITAGRYRLVRTYRQAGRTVSEHRQVTVR